ncbi:MAG: hypothetical protein ACJAYN_002415 [Bermanella sp.]|jgi:hypothetical protein|uniref:hypothetical protein n=1 Tax=Glaciecola sp. 33A TaxID=2057807 RepID=UPI000C32C533|nr:hypothetical protein [Glaciecola sp. 33A]PKI00169.1 hypothetical protein CXF81_18590 [Glaciecola sp. 33A]
MKKISKVILLCLVALTMAACDKPDREIKAGRYGMMSDETPQYAALVFIMAIYEDDNLDGALKLSTDKFAGLLKSYHTNSGVQRHILNLRLTEMTVEPVSGGFESMTEFKKEVTVDVKIIGTYNNRKITELKTISMIRQSGDWKIVGVSNTVP